MYEEVRKLMMQEKETGIIFKDIDVDAYLDKLSSSAEMFVSMDRGKCLGFVAYYCNDAASRIAYITLILLAPEARGSGLAQHLTDMVLETARRRQFNACRLEVRKINAHAQAFYRKLGFEQIEERPIKYLMERRL